MEKEFYEEKTHNFFVKHRNYEFRRTNRGDMPIFGNMASALGYIMGGQMINLNKIHVKGEADFGRKNLHIKGMMEKNPDDDLFIVNINFAKYSSNREECVVSLNPKYMENNMRLANGFYGVESLSYDGLCAYMALAPSKDIITVADKLNSQIDKNAEKEMLDVDSKKDGSADEVAEIGNKYVELKSCLVTLCDEYTKEQNENQNEYQNEEAWNKYVEMKSILNDAGKDVLKFANDNEELEQE